MLLGKFLGAAGLAIALCAMPSVCSFSQQKESMYGDAVKADVKMKYVYSYEEAIKRAKAEKKLIFFNCFADWAVPCHQMNAAVFSDQEFCDYMDKHFVNLFVDVTERGEGEALANKYQIKMFAHYLVLNDKGEVVLRIVGGKKLPEFKETVELALSDKTSLMGTEAKYNSGKYSKKDLLNYLNALNLADEDEKFQSVSKIYMGMISQKEYAKKENWNVFSKLVKDRESDLYAYLVDHKDEFVKNVGADQVNNLIERMYSGELFQIACGATPYKAEQMIKLYDGMQKAGLPEESPCVVIYNVAKLRGEKKYAELIQLMKEKGDVLQNARPSVELSFDFPDLNEADRKLVGDYLQERAEQSSGSTKERLADLAGTVRYGKEAGISFDVKTYDEALAKAKSENKLVFMDCYTSWCGPCKMMSSKVFTQKKVGDYFNQHLVSIKIDMEKGEGIKLAKKYGVKAYPTMMFLDTEGNVIHKIIGACDADKLIQTARDHSDPSKGYSVCKAAYESGNRTPEVVANYISTMMDVREMTPQQADSIVKDYCRTLSDDDFCTAEAWKLVDRCVLEPKGDAFERVMKLHDKLAQVAGEAAVNKKIERLCFPKVIGYYGNEVSKEELQGILGLLKQGNYPADYTLTLLAELVELNGVDAVINFYQTKVKAMKNPQDRLNMDTLLPYFVAQATDAQKEAIVKYCEDALNNCDKRAYRKYSSLLSVVKEGGYKN